MSLSKPSLLYVFIILALGMLAVALFYTFDALLTLQSTGFTQTLIYQLMTGLFGVVISAYLLTRFRKTTELMKPPIPPNVITIVECETCGLKSLRSFTKGDFVFKPEANCEKCKAPLLITGIYAEETKK